MPENRNNKRSFPDKQQVLARTLDPAVRAMLERVEALGIRGVRQVALLPPG